MSVYAGERLGQVVTTRSDWDVCLPWRKAGPGCYYKIKVRLGCVATLEKGWAGFYYKIKVRLGCVPIMEKGWAGFYYKIKVRLGCVPIQEKG